VVKEQGYLVPQKSAFNKIVGDSHFELEMASFLEKCEDIISYAKNYFSVHFKIDYRDADGEIKDYYPDFFVKVSQKELYIVETKGREDLDDPLKIARLKQWCEAVNKSQAEITCHCLYVRQEEYEKDTPKDFRDLAKNFKA
jgi:type III restriction enzyme